MLYLASRRLQAMQSWKEYFHVSAVKTKPRNKMSPAMLEAIVRIKTNLHFEGKCCRDFSPTQNMLELFNSSMYDTKTQNNEEYGDDIIMQDE